MPSKNQKKKMINRQSVIYKISPRKLLVGGRKGKSKSLIIRAKVKQRKINKKMREKNLLGLKLPKRRYKSLITSAGLAGIKRMRMNSKKVRKNRFN